MLQHVVKLAGRRQKMDEIGTVMAKLAGIRKAIAALLDETARDVGRAVIIHLNS